MTSCIPTGCLNRYATRVDNMVRRNVVLVNCLPGGWCRTSGAGPAAPPSPVMTSPDRASTRISRKPSSAAKQALVALMWRRTPARLRNSPRLESLPVFEQLTQTKRVTPHGIGGPASGLALDAITATSNRVRMMQLIALRAKWLTNRLARELDTIY